MIAHSFVLFRIPRVKEILGKSITSFPQIDIDIDSIPWLDKNQKNQFLAKEEHRSELRKMRENTKVTADIKNIKSRRKKVRRQNQQKEMKEMNKEHKEILKSRKANKKEDEISDDSMSED